MGSEEIQCVANVLFCYLYSTEPYGQVNVQSNQPGGKSRGNMSEPCKLEWMARIVSPARDRNVEYHEVDSEINNRVLQTIICIIAQKQPAVLENEYLHDL